MDEGKIVDIEPGFIYLIEADGVFKPGTIRCKLGKSVDKDRRLNQLLRVQPCTTYRMIDYLLCNNRSKTEQLFHQRYRQYNADILGSKEWFDFPPEILAQVKADFRELEKDRAWTPLPPLVDPKGAAPDESANLNPVRFLSQNQHQISRNLNHLGNPANQERETTQEPSSQSLNHPKSQRNQPQQAQAAESQSQNREQSPSPNAVEAEIVDEEECISSTPGEPSINNIFIFMNDSSLISRSSKRRNFLGGLVMTAFLGLLAVASLFQGSVPAVNVGETVNAGLAAAKNNDPNQARELFRNLQKSNGECEANLGESLVTAVEQSKSSNEFYQLADKPLRVANEQGCIKLR
jgi:hypothetical protein